MSILFLPIGRSLMTVGDRGFHGNSRMLLKLVEKDKLGSTRHVIVTECLFVCPGGMSFVFPFFVSEHFRIMLVSCIRIY